MNKIYLVDTNIIIAYLKKDPAVKIIFDLLLKRKIQVKISVITVIELLSYPQLNKLEEQAINKIIELLISVSVDSKIARKAAAIA
ncbi:MAG: PIN domain-containing protein [Candidatus Falkowbacteria bacterium]